MSYTLTHNAEYGSIEITFPGRPSAAIRNALKALRFRWHSVKMLWYGWATEAAVRKAIEHFGAYPAEDAETTEAEPQTVTEAPAVAEAVTVTETERKAGKKPAEAVTAEAEEKPARAKKSRSREWDFDRIIARAYKATEARAKKADHKKGVMYYTDNEYKYFLDGFQLYAFPVTADIVPIPGNDEAAPGKIIRGAADIFSKAVKAATKPVTEIVKGKSAKTGKAMYRLTANDGTEIFMDDKMLDWMPDNITMMAEKPVSPVVLYYEGKAFGICLPIRVIGNDDFITVTTEDEAAEKAALNPELTMATFKIRDCKAAYTVTGYTFTVKHGGKEYNFGTSDRGTCWEVFDLNTGRGWMYGKTAKTAARNAVKGIAELAEYTASENYAKDVAEFSEMTASKAA